MMRLKPSVSSCSPVAALESAFCAVADISLPFNMRTSLLILLGPSGPPVGASFDIHEALHVVAQLERMLSHEPLGPFGIARFECADDLLVIDDRASCPIVLEDRALANGANVEEETLGHLGNQPAFAEPDD